MADVRFQVFVSSTYTDLVEERQSAMSALLQLGAMPAGMELFPAADDEAWTLIQRVIDESDYYLLIVGGRYGSVTEEGISFTEKEYAYAVSQEKPVMAFLHADPDQIAVSKSDIDSQLRAKLIAFTERVKKAKHVKMWSSAEDLAGKIALSFNSFTRTYPAIGWVRGDAGDSPETLKALASAQARLAILEAEQGVQAASPPAGSAGLADGDECLELRFSAAIEITNLDRSRTSTGPKQTLTVESSVTWNGLLSELGPPMSHEASQGALQKRFVEAVRRLCTDDIERQAIAWLAPQIDPTDLIGFAAGKRKPSVQVRATGADPDVGDFETTLLQFEALGLIQQSQRKRAVADRGTYWALTPWGRRRLTQLRAVPTGTRRPPSEG